MSALAIEGLSVEYDTPQGSARVVDDVSFELAPGETLGLVGESGSGKSVTARAILGLIRPPNGRVAAGSVRVNGRETLLMSRQELDKLRGREIAIVFQDARRNLDPAFSVGAQIAEVVRAARQCSRKEAWARAVEMLDLVRIPTPSRRARDYPHQFSGGMAQRVMLAIALSCSPKILIADEPTTALDVIVQARILDLIRQLQTDLGLAVLFVSHDLGVIAEMCDRVAVMYAGQIVEQADAVTLYERPQHPYSAALLGALPSSHSARQLIGIPGVVPPAHDWPPGCRFHPRCAYAVEECRSRAPSPRGPSESRCIRADDIDRTDP